MSVSFKHKSFHKSKKIEIFSAEQWRDKGFPCCGNKANSTAVHCGTKLAVQCCQSDRDACAESTSGPGYDLWPPIRAQTCATDRSQETRAGSSACKRESISNMGLTQHDISQHVVQLISLDNVSCNMKILRLCPPTNLYRMWYRSKWSAVGMALAEVASTEVIGGL